MPWAVICDFCEAPAPLPGPTAGVYGHQLPDGWLWLMLGTGRGGMMNETDPEHRGLVCSGGCAVRLVARWQDAMAEERRAQAAEAERRQRAEQEDGKATERARPRVAPPEAQQASAIMRPGDPRMGVAGQRS